jgi:sterol desaturase/sphingolipid hydroxylase (fatty acid hydroxylase superfamily)
MNIWKSIILDRYSPAQIEFTGNIITQLTFFWIPSAIYLSLPYAFPDFAARSKLQQREKLPTPAELWECFTLVFRNQIFSCVLHLVLLLVLHVHLGVPYSYRFDVELPGLFEIIRDVVTCVLGREVLFYYIHYGLHRPWLYARIHKRHHRFTAPVALAAQ